MQIKIDHIARKAFGKGKHRKKISVLLDGDEYSVLRERAHKNDMQTPQYLYNLLRYAMSDDSWID
ncbi:MAG: hypothetical protein LUG27_00250 [Clostridiales bacterium]|nr:hypothetical protein [Clostridiales bacterium]